MIGTRPLTQLLAVAAALGIGAACTNSGLGDGTAVGTVVGTPGGGTAGATPGDSCPYVGTWELTAAECGAFDIGPDWFAVYAETTLEISDSGEGDGSCDVVFVWNNAGCAERETWTITSIAAGTASIKFDGITHCEPAGCTFFASDPSCVQGDRSSGPAQDFGFEDLGGNSFGMIGLLAWGYPQCTLDLATEWNKQ